MKPTIPVVRAEPDAALAVQIIGGPDCSPPMDVPVGRHVIGRSPTACLHVDDPDLELHHALLCVDTSGEASVHQLSGRRPMSVLDANGSRTPPAPGGAFRLGHASSIDLGSTEVRVTMPSHVSHGDRRLTALPPLVELLGRLRGEGDPTETGCGQTSPSVSLGVGDTPSVPPATESAAGDLTAAPQRRSTFPWTPRPGSVTWVTGPRPACRALVRSVIVQLAIICPRSTAHVTVEADTAHSDWTWLTTLPCGGAQPHAGTELRSIRIVDGGTAHRGDDDSAVIVIADPADVPNADTIQIGTTGRARWAADPADRWFTATGLGPRRAADIAHRLSGGEDTSLWRCGHAVGGSPSNQRGPEPNADAASSVL